MPYNDDLKEKADDIEELLVKEQMIDDIYNFAKNLKQLDSDIFLFRYFYQLKPREIADKLNITAKEVSNRLYNSKKSLINKIKL